MDLTKIKQQQQFCQACRDGNLSLAKNLVDVHNVDPSVYFCRGLYMACAGGHIDIVEWLMQLVNVRNIVDYNMAFEAACESANIAMVKLIKSAPNFNIEYVRMSDVLCVIASMGHIEFVLQIIDEYQRFVNRHDIKLAFGCACGYGHLVLAQKLAAKYNINVATRQKRIFNTIYMNGHIDVANWIYSVCQPNIIIDDNISVDDFPKAKYLYEIGIMTFGQLNKIFALYNSYQIIEHAFNYDFVAVVESIIKLNLSMSNTIIRCIFNRACRSNKLSIVKLLIATYANIDFRRVYDEWCNDNNVVGIDVVIYMCEIYGNTIYLSYLRTQKIYDNANVEFVKFIRDSNPQFHTSPTHRDFITACRRGHLSMAQYIASELDNCVDYDSAFVSSSKFRVANWIASIHPQVVTKKNVARLLLNGYHVYSHKGVYNMILAWGNYLDNNTYGKLLIVYCGTSSDTSLKIVIYLCNICRNFADNHVKEAFIMACCNGNYITTNYLFDNFQIDTSCINYEIFYECCQNLDLDLAMWLYKLCGLDVSMRNCKIFKKIYKLENFRGGDSRLTKWLISLYNVEYVPILLNIVCGSDTNKIHQKKVIDYIIRFFDVNSVKVESPHQNFVDSRISRFHGSLNVTKTAKN